MTIPRVLNKNILSRRVERGTVKNGVIIPVNLHQQKEYQVCAIGSNVKDIAVGDLIAIGYVSHDVVYNEIPYSVCEEDQVLAILPQE